MKKPKAEDLSAYWKHVLAEYVKAKRGDRDQSAFKEDYGLDRDTFSRIESESGNVTFDKLIQVIVAVGGDVSEVFQSKLPAKFRTADHQDLHEKLQELLDASGKWPIAARVNVDAVYNLYLTERQKGKNGKS